MQQEQKRITPAEIVEMAADNGLVERRDASNIDLAMSYLCGHGELTATRYFTGTAIVAAGEAKLAYFPLAYLRTPPRRSMLLSDMGNVLDGTLFPEDFEIHAALPAYDDGGQVSHGIMWDEFGWYVRESIYSRARTLPEYLGKLNNFQTWWHFPLEVDDAPGMISYVPSHAYGKSHRRVRTKVGRYLTQFFSKQLTESQIRDIANLATTGGLTMSSDPDAFVNAYVSGPDSCMAGSRFKAGEMHPALCYTYPGEFQMATITDAAGQITARALVHMRSKKVIRLYGKDGPKLESKLKQNGITKADRYPFGTKFKVVTVDHEQVRLPYIDGEQRYVEFREGKDGAEDYFELVEGNGSRKQLYGSHQSCTHPFTKPVKNRECSTCGEMNYGHESIRVYNLESRTFEYHCLHGHNISTREAYDWEAGSVMVLDTVPVMHLVGNGTAFIDSAANRKNYDVIEARGGRLAMRSETVEVNGELYVLGSAEPQDALLQPNYFDVYNSGAKSKYAPLSELGLDWWVRGSIRRNRISGFVSNECYQEHKYGRDTWSIDRRSGSIVEFESGWMRVRELLALMTDEEMGTYFVRASAIPDGNWSDLASVLGRLKELRAEMNGTTGQTDTASETPYVEAA